MNMYLVHGEDTPHQDNTPYRTYIVLAPDEPTARQLAESMAFRVDHVQLAKEYPHFTLPALLNSISGARPMHNP
jgi:hypothetical protein